MSSVLSMSVASDLAQQLLKEYIRTQALSQTTQNKPLAKILRANSRKITGGLGQISEPVQGAYMSDVAGFFAGYSEDDALTFTQGQNVLRAEATWYEHHSGLEITWTELKKDGITITDDGNEKEHAGADAVRITKGVLKNRIQDFGESWARSFNNTCWLDGTQDAKAFPGVLAILTDTPSTGSTHGLSRATYTWWRHRALVGANRITASAAAQTLTKTLRAEMRQLMRYSDGPDTLLCGSGFIEALELEVHEKGIYTQQGFANKGKNDIGMGQISMRGVGDFQYDPTLDTLGLSKRCYAIASDHLVLRPMEGEDNKVLNPTRPYNCAVYLQSMTWTGGLLANQLNCHGVYEVA